VAWYIDNDCKGLEAELGRFRVEQPREGRVDAKRLWANGFAGHVILLGLAKGLLLVHQVLRW